MSIPYSEPFIIQTPIPHILLIPPYSGYCLTGFLSTDPPQLPEIFNHPQVEPTIGYRQEESMTLQGAERYLNARIKDTRDWPFWMIRSVDSLRDDEPVLMGIFAIRRDEFRFSGPDKEAGLREANDKLPSEKAQYHFTMFINPKYGKQGIVTAAGKTAIGSHPYIRAYPGQLSGGWLEVPHSASKRVNGRLGFAAMGRRKNVYKDLAVVGAIWADGGEVKKEDTLYRDLDDLLRLRGQLQPDRVKPDAEPPKGINCLDRLYNREYNLCNPAFGFDDDDLKFALATADKPVPDDLLSATLRDIVQALDDRRINSTQLVQAYLERIEKNNLQGLELRAVIETAPHVLETARQLDEERSAGRMRSRLHGVPILIKDTIATQPDMGMETTGGTFALYGSRVPANAPVIDNLVSAGILILGKTNLTALGNIYGLDTPNGWSPLGGQTRSAYGPGTLDPIGSSTGSAVSVSAGFCAASIGEETYRVDCLGPLGKSTWDLAALLESMLLQHDSYIPFTSPPHNDITRYKIGIVRRRFPADDAMGEDAKNDDEANALYERSLESLRASGAKMVDPADIQDVEQLWTQEAEENDDGAELGGVSHPAGGDEGRARPESGPLIVTELYEAMNAYLSRLTDCKVKSIEELVEWNERNPASSDQAFIDPNHPERQGWLQRASETKGIKGAAYDRALKKVLSLASKVEAAFEEHGADVLVFPGGLTQGTKTPAVAASRGFPLATIPLGILESGEPYAMYIMGKRGADRTVLGVMAACESIFPARRVPSLMRE
ncbi:MAG: hypothetical protein TREMPRED_004126 [Tremellales sp. Tagirdzhanova-0007]|nr:MAG: hypothetical protein TREMPRED_004126 [Tremellales sp. Tagirdzhanova-0007]